MWSINITDTLLIHDSVRIIDTRRWRLDTKRVNESLFDAVDKPEEESA